MNRMSLRSLILTRTLRRKRFLLLDSDFWILFSTLLENEPKTKEKLTTTR